MSSSTEIQSNQLCTPSPQKKNFYVRSFFPSVSTRRPTPFRSFSLSLSLVLRRMTVFIFLIRFLIPMSDCDVLHPADSSIVVDIPASTHPYSSFFFSVCFFFLFTENNSNLQFPKPHFVTWVDRNDENNSSDVLKKKRREKWNA